MSQDQKVDSPTDLSRQSWAYVMRKTYREFQDDHCPDLAAGLTYYAVLSLFPAAIAVVSLLGVIGQGQSSVDKVIEILQPLVSTSTLDTVQPALEHIASSRGAGLGLVLGLLGALWSASGYVGAFGRAMNRVYEVDEGRPFWKLRPWTILVTLVAILLVACVLVMLIVAMLYYATPNVKQPRFRWLSVGAFVAIVVWIAASVAFAFYVASFGSYNKTYGSLAGAIAGLLWLWITNLALLFGAQLDSELERGRELEAGIAAEEQLQLPARDSTGIRKARKKEKKDLARGRAIREQAGKDDKEAS
jgi:membrane protein